MLTRQHPGSRTRCVLVVVAATTGGAAAVRVLVPAAAGPVGTVDEALVRVCVAGLLAAVGWAWLATMCVVGEAWRGSPARTRVSAPLRRVVLLCCGVVLTAPVSAASGDDRPPPGPTITGLPLPERATGPAHRATSAVVDTPRVVVVRAGDCLWRLAAADLPRGASPARVVARWHAIHALNAAAIGPDPDLIHPGQRLALPPAEPRH